MQRYRWLHRNQRDHLKHVVLDHVADHAGFVVITAAALNANGLGVGDLDVIDVLAVPERLENTVGKPKHQQVLNSFFAEVMIDAINLVLFKNSSQFVVQCAGALEIVTKWFLNDDARPAGSRLGETEFAQFAGDRPEKFRRSREVEDAIASSAPAFLNFGQ